MPKREREREKNTIPIRIDYTEDLHSCFAKRTAKHYMVEDCHTFKESQFLVFCGVGVHFIQLIAEKEYQLQIILFPELNFFKSWFLTLANNKKTEFVVVFARNRFSELHWLLLIAAVSLVGTVPTFKQTVLPMMWTFLCTRLSLTRQNKYPWSLWQILQALFESNFSSNKT